ncbi:hypothetical protein SteCoe_9909 [Stentor coeruleus]|uniref:Membrane transporter protein n=1 Tax=Stentor coeruleus TaxID=5963 RepID=A0A1R2CGV9_9CILI|nr:hypothetical protein SteCoe_9909 [Stentor coeruleus]
MKLLILFILITLSYSSSCESNNDCPSNNFCDKGKCAHKYLFPLSGMEILGTLLIFVCSALANAGGQGGGPLMTLILISIFKYDTHIALPMVQLIILGGSFIGFILKVHVRHPTRSRPVIDYYILLLFTPPLLLGTTIGVLLGFIFPAWLILVLLTLVLIWVTYTCAEISIKLIHKENAEKRKIADNTIVTGNYEDLNAYEKLLEANNDLKKIIDSEKKWFPLTPIIIFLGVYAFAIITFFLRGSPSSPSIIGVDHCSGIYWVINCVVFIGFVGLTGFVVWFVVADARKKQVLGYDFDDCDVVWKSKPAIVCVISGILAGIGASLLSIGGALVLGPIMLRLGLRSEVSTSTSRAIVVLTSSISIIQYSIAGKLEMIYGLWFFTFSLLGSVLGILAVKALVDQYNRGSIVVIVLTILMGLCAILTPSYGIIELTSQNSSEIGLRSFCS